MALDLARRSGAVALSGDTDEHPAVAAAQPAGAVGVVGERAAAAVRGEAALLAELGEHGRGAHHHHAARERDRALAVAQGGGGEVQRGERGGARGVDRDRGALEAEGVGEAAGQDAGGGTGEQVARDLVGHLGQADPVAHGAAADEHAGLAAAQGPGVDSGPFEHFPRRFQQQPLLRIHGQRLARGNTEERGLEIGRVIEEPAALDRENTVLGAPAAVVGKRGNGVATGVDQPPQIFRRPDPTGITAAHRHDRDRLLVTLLQLLKPLPGGVEIRRHQFEILPERVFIRHLRAPLRYGRQGFSGAGE